MGNIQQGNLTFELLLICLGLIFAISALLFADHIAKWLYWIGMTVVSKLNLKFSHEPDEIIMNRWLNGWYHKLFILAFRIVAGLFAVFLIILIVILLAE
jgi:hypothetical protein